MAAHTNGSGLFDEKEIGSLMRLVTMERLRFFSALCFTAGLAVHLLTFRGGDHSDIFGWAVLLHICCIISVFMMIAMMTKRGERQDKFWPRFLGTRRGLTRWAGIFVIIYGLACMPLTISEMNELQPEKAQGGGLVLEYELVHEDGLSPEAEARYNSYEMRIFSALWLIFFYFPMIYAWQADDLRYISENVLMELDEPPDE